MEDQHRKRYGDDASLRRMQTENYSVSRGRNDSQRRFWDTVMTNDAPPPTPSLGSNPSYPRMDSSSLRHYQSHSFHVPNHAPDVLRRRKDFKCETCHVSFSQKSHLTQHVKTVHEKIRPHKCDQCNRAFGKRYDLVSHIDAVHKKERPHACIYCDKQFAKRSNLTRHVEHMHPEKHHHRKTAL